MTGLISNMCVKFLAAAQEVLGHEPIVALTSTPHVAVICHNTSEAM